MFGCRVAVICKSKRRQSARYSSVVSLCDEPFVGYNFNGPRAANGLLHYAQQISTFRISRAKDMVFASQVDLLCSRHADRRNRISFRARKTYLASSLALFGSSESEPVQRDRVDQKEEDFLSFILNTNLHEHLSVRTQFPPSCATSEKSSGEPGQVNLICS